MSNHEKYVGSLFVSPGIFIRYLRSLMAMKSICSRLALVGSDCCLVLTYHRVLPKNKVGSRVEPGMYITPEVLGRHLRFLKRNFHIIGVDRLESVLMGGGDGRKPFCVLTFDDGWLDFYSHAWPVLRGENVPAVVYLPTALIGTESSFWTDRLARLIETKNGRNILVAQLTEVSREKTEDVELFSLERFDRAIELLKQYTYATIENLLAACEAEIETSAGVSSRSFMNWDEVSELYGSGLISFGSHTVHHAILTTLSAGEIISELQESKEKLQSAKVTGERLSFCYPNGNYSSQIAAMVKDCGYASAMTCDSGWNRVGDDLVALKRISLHQDVSFTDSLFAYRLRQFSL